MMDSPPTGPAASALPARALKQLRDAIAELLGWAPDPRTGLPEELFLFVSRVTPLINVDLFVQDQNNRTLLTWREDEIHGAGWHIPGGIVRYQETLETRIHATALRELGADVEFEPAPIAMEQMILPERSVRGHFLSLTYRCRLVGAPNPDLQFLNGTPRNGEWAWHDGCPSDLISLQNVYRRFFAPPG
jgi:ADP-ribose pyrophosphatase YjhB (NUDIX family)